MPFRWIGILGFLLVFAGKLRAQGEIVLSVGSDSVSRAEWVHACRQSPHAAADSGFLNAFIAHKLRVCAAREAGVDTSQAFRASWHWLRTRLQQRYRLDGPREEQALRHLYLRAEKRLRQNRWVRVAHISRYLPQQGGKELERRTCQLMDSLYVALQAGADFAALARRFSDDRTSSAQGGLLPWMPVNRQVDEWVVQLDDLACQEVSRPFFSPLGVHLLKWVDRKDALSFEECRRRLAAFRESRGEVVTRRLSAAEEQDWRLEEKRQYEGLLVAYAASRASERSASVDDLELKRFFARHRDRYAWSLPHYRGAVIAGTDRKGVKRLRKLLKKRPFGQWQETVRAWRDHHPQDSMLQVEIGLFPLGKKPAVDRLVYRCGDWVPDARRPEVQVVGRNLKHGPEHWDEVAEAVRADYLNDRREKEMQALRQKYRVEIDKEVLKSVNIDGIH